MNLSKGNFVKMNDVMGLLGLSRRAGKLSMGFDVTVESINLKAAFLVLIASDCSKRTSGEIIRICENNRIAYKYLPLTMDEIDYTLGKRSGVMAVCEKNISEKIMNIIAGV